MKIKKIIAMLIPFAMTMASCSETDYMTFDTNDSGVYFTKDTLEYSFGVTPVEVRSHTYKVPFRIMGPTSKDSRKVNFSIDASKTTAQEGVQYRIGEAVVIKTATILSNGKACSKLIAVTELIPIIASQIQKACAGSIVAILTAIIQGMNIA